MVGCAECSCPKAVQNKVQIQPADIQQARCALSGRAEKEMSAGVHYEHLLITRDNSAPGAPQDYYRWIGPYMELKLAGGMAFRFTGGKDLTDNEDFYKMKFTKTF